MINAAAETSTFDAHDEIAKVSNSQIKKQWQHRAAGLTKETLCSANLLEIPCGYHHHQPHHQDDTNRFLTDTIGH